MTPYRLGQMQAWIERCPSCDAVWVDQHDRRTMDRQAIRRAQVQTYDSMSENEQAEYKEVLTALTPPTMIEPSLSPFHTALAMFGFPVITRYRKSRNPLLTWGLIGLILGLHPFVDPDGYSYVAGQGSVLTAFTSLFVHFGWVHLLGNLYFLFAFGDGLEQKMPRWLFGALFFVGGAVATVIEGGFAHPGIMIGGASGAVSVVMGACVVLQPSAKVAIGFRFRIFRLPIIVFGLLEVGFQALMVMVDVPGVAWLAHLSGLGIGVVGGFAVRMTAWGRDDRV